MGFISIFGIAVQDAILVVTYFQRLHLSEGHSIELAAREAAEKRFRPVLMTTLVAMLGLMPAALSNGIGAQTQKPLAIVVIGGSLILAVLTRILQPPLLVLAHQWMERRRPQLPSRQEARWPSRRVLVCIGRFQLRARVAHPVAPFPPTSLKFRTAGFPQYGSQYGFKASLSDETFLSMVRVKSAPSIRRTLSSLSSPLVLQRSGLRNSALCRREITC
jgi:hypothetical protein